MHIEKPDYPQFCEKVKGYDIQKVRTGDIIPRFVIYHTMSADNVISIMERRHPMFKFVDREGFKDGKLIHEIQTHEE